MKRVVKGSSSGKKSTVSHIREWMIVLLLIFIPVLLQYYVRTALPETMIGAEGLKQLHTYLVRFNLVSVIRIVLYLLAAIILIRVTVQLMKRHKSVLNIVFSVMIFSVLIFMLEPQRSYVDIQGEQFSSIPTVHAFRLLCAVEKDLDADPVLLSGDMSLRVMQNDYSYTVSSRHHRSKHKVTEYSLETETGVLIAQISVSDYTRLKPYVGAYTTHEVMCYPNSGLLYALDDGEPPQTNAEAEEEFYASQYTLTYEEDGYLRWTPIGDNLSLVIEADGTQTLQWNADGKSEYHPLFHAGHENTAYLEQWVNGKGFTRVSNIITVTEPYVQEKTEYAPPDLIGEMLVNGDGTTHCTVLPYGLSIDLPDVLLPVRSEDSITSDINGAECDLFESSQNEYMVFKMWWEYSPYLFSTEWGLEDRGQNYFGSKYEGSDYRIDPLDGFDEAYSMLVSPGSSNLNAYYLYAIVRVGADEYIKLCIAYADAGQETAAYEILDSMVLENTS